MISNSTYTSGIFDHSKFIIDVDNKFNLPYIIANKHDIKATDFVKFIMDADEVYTKYNNAEVDAAFFGEQLKITENTLNKFFIIDFQSVNHQISKKEKKILELLKVVQDTETILITLKENSVNLNKEFDHNKKTLNDTGVRDMIVNKLKKINEKMIEYEAEKVRIVNDVKILRDENNALIKKRNDACVNYYDCEVNYINNNNKLHNIISNLDSVYLKEITVFMKKYELPISNYILVDQFVKLLKYAIENLKILFDTYDLGFTLDTIKSCFLNCNYTESETVNGINYSVNSGIDIYKSQVIKPAYTVKLKSFKILYYVIDTLETINETMKQITMLKDDIKLANTDELKKRAMSKIIIKLYENTKLIFQIMYGDYGNFYNNIIFKGLYERGSISTKTYLNEFQHSIYKMVSGKETDKIKYKSIYIAIIKNIYGLLSVVNLKELDNDDSIKLYLNTIRNYLTDLQPIELYNATIIHHKINKRGSHK